MKLINLTSHHISIATDEGTLDIQPSGDVARIATRYEAHQIINVDGYRIGIHSVRNTNVIGLPEPEPDTFYIVSSIIAHAANRKDVLYPGHSHRDSDGNIIACDGLLVPELATKLHSDSNTAEILHMTELGMKQKNIALMLGITPQAVSAALKRYRQSTIFSDSELCLIVKALETPIHIKREIPSYQFYISINVVDAITLNGLDEGSTVDRKVLLKKLETLTESDAKTLNARVEAFWKAAPHTDMIAGLREAGL